MKVKALVINAKKEELGSCTFERASALLSDGKARVYSFYPYTIMMKPSEPAYTNAGTNKPLPFMAARKEGACHV